MATKDAPTLKDHPVLDDWLTKHDARWGWSYVVGKARVEGWRVGTGLMVIWLYDNRSWDIFTALGSTNDIAETLADAEKRLGVR